MGTHQCPSVLSNTRKDKDQFSPWRRHSSSSFSFKSSTSICVRRMKSLMLSWLLRRLKSLMLLWIERMTFNVPTIGVLTSGSRCAGGSYGRCSVWPGMSVGIMLNVSSGCWTNPLESVSLVCVELSTWLDLEFSETKWPWNWCWWLTAMTHNL